MLRVVVSSSDRGGVGNFSFDCRFYVALRACSLKRGTWYVLLSSCMPVATQNYFLSPNCSHGLASSQASRGRSSDEGETARRIPHITQEHTGCLLPTHQRCPAVCRSLDDPPRDSKPFKYPPSPTYFSPSSRTPIYYPANPFRLGPRRVHYPAKIFNL